MPLHPSQPPLEGLRAAQILESITDAFFALDREWRFTYLNAEAERLLRRPRAELLGRPIWEEFPEAVGSTFQFQYQRALLSSRKVEFEEFYPPLQRWFEVHAYPSAEGLAVYFNDISERKRMEQALRESEERFRAVQEASPDGFMLFHALRDARGALEDFAWVFTNPAAERIVGRRDRELRGKRLLQEMPGNRDSGLFDRYVRVVESGEPDRHEFPYHAEGLAHWFRSTAVRVGDGFAVTFTDISAEKRAEQAVRDSEDLFRTLVNSIPQLAWMADPSGAIFWYNQRWYDYTGTRPEEAEGWGWQNAHHPQQVERVAARFRRALELGEPWEDTFPLRSAGGDYRWFLSRAVPVRDAGGRIVRWLGTNTDITERLEAEAERERLIHALGTERGRLSEIFLQAPAFIAVLRGPEHVFELANPLYRQLVGEREVVGRPVREALPEVEGQGFLDLLDRVYTTGEPFSASEMHVRLHRDRDGVLDDRFLNFVYQPLREADGTVSGVFVHGVDVTDQVQARRQIERLLVEVQQASQAKSNFLATMSHELRTPLNAMIGYTDLLLMGIPEAVAGEARRQVERIGLSARHLLQLIEEVLAFSRIEAGREEVQCEPVSLGEVLDEVRAIIEPLAQGKGLVFRIQASAAPRTLYTDPRKLRQILVNLLGNAVKFTERGEVALEVEPGDDQLAFRVSDTGIGIAPEHQPQLFQPFWQADQTSRRATGGTGLGLAITRRLTRMLGGEITLRSTPGRGSVFSVRLPA